MSEIDYKKCKTCQQDKPLSDYQKAGKGKWLQPYCKPCDSERKRKHYIENKERYKILSKANYEATKVIMPEEQKIESRIRSNKALVEAGRAYNMAKKMTPDEKKRRKSENDRRYREKNADKIKAAKKRYYDLCGLEKAKEWQKKNMNNLEFRTKKRLRGRIYVALKRGIKSQSTMELLGCSIDKFKIHLESLFTDGMNWDKYMAGEIDIDHIKPCKHFDLTNPDEQKQCFFYKNLQPLWHLDNLRKGTFYQEENKKVA